MMRVVTVALALGLGAIGCAGSQHAPQHNCELRVVAEPATAVVLVNERFIGAARVLDKHPAKLTGGKKRVTLEAPGYFPHDMVVELTPGVTTVKAALRPIPK